MRAYATALGLPLGRNPSDSGDILSKLDRGCLPFFLDFELDFLSDSMIPTFLAGVAEVLEREDDDFFSEAVVAEGPVVAAAMDAICTLLNCPF